jgi:hypothetical protein
MKDLHKEYYTDPKWSKNYKLYTVTIERKEVSTVLARNDEEALIIAKLKPDTIEYKSEQVDTVPTCSWNK